MKEKRISLNIPVSSEPYDLHTPSEEVFSKVFSFPLIRLALFVGQTKCVYLQNKASFKVNNVNNETRLTL